MKRMLLLLLAGCGSAPLTQQRVEVPVFTSCVKGHIPRPADEFDKLTSTATDGEIVLALARDWIRGRQYEGQSEVALSGCY
ncbi:hypothetical protein [Janthinobacterium sp.]|uniref:hypothetical protein n=1 Tax=Janthinobacterium sp. TaxID=1871054 RepID=UPI00258F7B47|nr:hypothetical protein [Janthinobacterium sp.]MCX7289580.1 hypothetical protein [Janthinobacterium sp.]